VLPVPTRSPISSHQSHPFSHQYPAAKTVVVYFKERFGLVIVLCSVSVDSVVCCKAYMGEHGCLKFR